MADYAEVPMWETTPTRILSFSYGCFSFFTPKSPVSASRSLGMKLGILGHKCPNANGSCVVASQLFQPPNIRYVSLIYM
jgi:hypothetical protein